MPTLPVARAYSLPVARHPLVEALLLEEIDRLHVEEMDLDSIEEFKYTKAVIQEALRLYPPATAILREGTPSSANSF